MIINEFTYYWFVTGMAMIFPHVISAFLLPKRRYAAVRFTVGIILSIVLSWLDLYMPVSMLSFLVLHAAALGFLIFCNRLDPWMYLYYFVWGVAFYFLAEQLGAVLASLFDRYNVLPVMYLFKLVSIALVTVLQVWILLFMRKKGVEKLPWRQIVLSALISFSIITINMVSFSMSGQQGLFIFMFQFFSMITVVLILFIQLLSQDRDRRRNEAEFFEFLWRSNQKDYEMKEAYLDLVNHKYHDMKHEIQALRQMPGDARKERLDTLEQLIDGYQNLYETGNKALDTILNDKRRECENRKILLTCTANVENLEFIDLVDLHILLGNLFDNAIEAVFPLPEEQRIIDFKIYADKGFLRIQESNYYAGELKLAGDRLISSKGSDGIYHGFGTRSMRYIVDRYHGELTISSEGSIFRLYILIPFPETQSQEAV